MLKVTAMAGVLALAALAAAGPAPAQSEETGAARNLEGGQPDQPTDDTADAVQQYTPLSLLE